MNPTLTPCQSARARTRPDHFGLGSFGSSPIGLVLLIVACCHSASGDPPQPMAARPIVTAGLPPAMHRTDTLAQAQLFDRQGQAQAVDYFFLAAVQAADGLAPGPYAASSELVYHQALSGLLDAGQRYGRLDPRGQLIVMHGGRRVIPIRYFGFAWQPRDFSHLAPANQSSNDIAHHYANSGLGVPLIAARISARANEPFFAPWQPFAVTAVLRRAADGTDAALDSPASPYVLDFYNPLVFDTVTWRGMRVPLAADLTAPIAAVVNEAPRQYLRGFTAPSDTSVQPKLTMLEPYQPGKIPVVLIHGLYSDPITWADMINDLRSQREIYDRFQFWAFRYPTGGDLMTSTVALRQTLLLIRQTYDPQHADPAMNSMVLVGHSLGGLVAKMQVTSSYDLLWREAAVQPFSALRAPPELQARLARGFFFQPVPMVKQVIFIGTPHRGSGMASRAAGRVGSLLVQYGGEEEAKYDELIEQNRDVFKPFLRRGRPTAISLLEPESPFLDGLAKLPVNCQTRLHSIIGTGGHSPLEPGDGIVPVASARHYGDSELFVPARHEKLHRDPASIAEVSRILRQHAAAIPCQAEPELASAGR